MELIHTASRVTDLDCLEGVLPDGLGFEEKWGSEEDGGLRPPRARDHSPHPSILRTSRTTNLRQGDTIHTDHSVWLVEEDLHGASRNSSNGPTVT